MYRITRIAPKLRPGLRAGASRRSSLSEEPRLPLLLRDRRACGCVPRLVLLVEPAVDECPDQGAGRDTASEALAAQPRVDAFFEAHRNRLRKGPISARNATRSDLHPPTATRNRCGNLTAMGPSFVATSETTGKAQPFLLKARDVQVWPRLEGPEDRLFTPGGLFLPR
jgi:hypothetical protein